MTLDALPSALEKSAVDDLETTQRETGKSWLVPYTIYRLNARDGRVQSATYYDSFASTYFHIRRP